MITANCPAEFFIWANALNDLQMAAVLAAYHVADGAPLSENECAAFATLTRKTARKKKHQLIELGLLYRDREFVNGQHDPCRIHRERFLQWISTAGVNLPRSEAATGVNLPRSEAATGVNLPRSETPPYKERAPAPASSDLASLGSKLACAEQKVQAEENAALEEAIADAIRRSRLEDIGGESLADKPFTIPTLRKALAPIANDEAAVKIELDRIERKCEYVRRHPDSAESWGVLVAMVRADVKTFLKDAAPERKPPQKEESDLADEWLQVFPHHPQAKAAKA